MKKSILIPLIIIVAAIVGLPYVNGMLMEKLVTRMCKDVNQMYADTGYDFRIELVDYDRGFADSRIEWRIDFGELQSIYKVENVILVENAKHGWFGVTSETSLEKNEWFSNWVTTQQNGQNPLKIRTHYPILGPIVSEISQEKISIDTKNGPVDIGTLSLSFSVDKDMTALNSRGRWDGFSEVDGNTMGPINFEADYDRVTHLIWEGKGKINLERFMVNDNQSTVNASDLTLDFDLGTSKNKKAMNIDMGISLGTIVMDDQSFSDWTARWGIKHIDIQAYESLMMLYFETLNTMFSQLSDPNLNGKAANGLMESAMTRNAPQLMAAFEKILKKDFEIWVSNLAMELPQGKIKGDFSLGLKKDMTILQFYPILSQPSYALDIFFLKSNCSIPLDLVRERTDLLTPIFPGMKTGLFIQKGTDLHHQAKIRGNKLYLNGEEVVLN